MLIALYVMHLVESDIKWPILDILDNFPSDHNALLTQHF